ncbi:MAG: hypothetical protein CMB99_03580 [Flavobacteriaceae bacterium]|nr:hypothetical protein [Flavobacteriaceae bacterium]|tara:strand:- start:141200 stop:141601 length:402 start_codon:yes stop_codon:yes gene_type:complete
MRLFIIAAFLFCFCMPSQTHAQKIVKFAQYKLYKSNTGSTKIKIEPLARMKNVGKDESKYEKSFGVYGVLICYSLNGERKAKRQDMTSKLKQKGYFELTLAFGNKAKVSGVSVSYFNMIDEPKSSWPKKGDCF